jgi:DNA-binding XRE family transcriptional regulator
MGAAMVRYAQKGSLATWRRTTRLVVCAIPAGIPTEGVMDADLSADLDIGADLNPRITGAQLRAARAMLNVSQAQVAKRLAVDRHTIWHVECDRGTERTRCQLEGLLKRDGVIFGAGGTVSLKKPIER